MEITLAKEPLRNRGIQAALVSAFFLGMTPVFGKQAILLGFAPLAVVALRTLLAVILLAFGILLIQRKYFYIYPIGLAGCILAGVVNGAGSLLYYSALGRLDASLGQMLYSLYPHFLALYFILDRQSFNRVTLLRLLISIPAVYLLIQPGHTSVDIPGVIMMLLASALYAAHLMINQRVLYEVPAPTVTLYTLVAMTVTTSIGFFIFSRQFPARELPWWPVLALAAVTFLSRLTLFTGVKHAGGLQTALIGLLELLVTLVFAITWLGERLALQQWLGALLLIASVGLVAFDRFSHVKRYNQGLFAWLRPPDIPQDTGW